MKKLFLLLILSLFVQIAFAQDDKTKVLGEVTVTAKYANADPLYLEIRQESKSADAFTEYASVNNLVLQKDIGTFLLQTGEIYFLKADNGRYIGGVFIGNGIFSLTPINDVEKNSVKIFTDTTEVKEPFSQLVMFFTDKTYDEIKNSPNAKMLTNGSSANRAKEAFQEKETVLRERFRYNISSRTLSDFLSPNRQGFFTTFIEGKSFGKLVYQIDPLGIPEVYPEQVALISYGESNGGILTAFHLQDEYKKGTATSWTDRRTYDIISHKLDVNIQNTKLIVSDEITMQMREKDVKFLPFDLFRSLRVKTVKDENNNELSYIQEDKNKDADFGVILPNAYEVGKPFKLIVEYEGNEALLQRGSGTFDLLPRSTWYPNNPASSFGDRATFDLTFHYPKKYSLVGVGNRIGEEKILGETKTAQWSTEGVDFAVAGFNYGEFKVNEVVDNDSGYKIEAYANKELPDEMRSLQVQIEEAENRGAVTGTTLGSLNTTEGLNLVLTDAQNSMRLYNAYFGKVPYKRLAMTQQPNTFFGQAWATLIFMPYMAYVNSTQRVQLFGIRGGTQGFWTEVAPHEVAHEWWGHTLGWTSYHDQWMSEGFSQFSASLFIQYVRRDMKRFNEFWEGERRKIVLSSPATKGLKPYTVGPVTQGYRLNTAKTGAVAQFMIYPKGGYILHMLRMLMYDHKNGTGDAKFKEMMKDFVKTNYNKDISTNDFKIAVEKYMTPEMNTMGDGKMDWFFDQWVYGTDVPAYELNYQITKSSDGKPIFNGKITQSGVSDKFVMLVPLYMDFGKGFVFLGRARITGNKTLEIKDLPLPAEPKAVSIDAYKDILNTDIKGK